MDDSLSITLIGDAPQAFVDALPDAVRWTPDDRRAPGEAARQADFAFVFATEHASVPDLVEGRGLAMMMQGGACVVACDLGERGEAQRLAVILDDAGLDFLDLAWLPAGARIAVGGERDTFAVLRDSLKKVGHPFYVGPAGSSVTAVEAEREALAAGADETALASIFGRVEAQGAFAAPVRNLMKAGPSGSPAFDAIVDALTRRR